MKIREERLELIQPTDKFIVSYPRSGNTWLRFLFRDAAVYEKEGRDVTVHQNDVIPDIHVMDQELGLPIAVKYFGHERILKSHNIDQLEGHRLVYLFRFPADVLVSHYFHYMRKAHHRQLAEELGIEGFCLQYLERWGEHMAALLKFEDFSNALLIPYERLHADPVTTLDAAMEFLGVRVSAESIRFAVEKNQFERLQREEQSRLDSQGRPVPQPMFRKGIVGDARNHLRPDVLAMIEAPGNRLYQLALEISNQQFLEPFTPQLAGGPTV